MKPSYRYRATVARIVDGDTAYIDVDMGFYLTARQCFRFAHVNTPEKRDYEAWKAAKDRVESLMPVDSIVMVDSLGQDKYGRWLGVFHVGVDAAVSVNQTLLDEGLAVPYEGR